MGKVVKWRMNLNSKIKSMVRLVSGIESQALLPTEIFTVLSDEFSE